MRGSTLRAISTASAGESPDALPTGTISTCGEPRSSTSLFVSSRSGLPRWQKTIPSAFAVNTVFQRCGSPSGVRRVVRTPRKCMPAASYSPGKSSATGAPETAPRAEWNSSSLLSVTRSASAC